jgi:hypothetical protein
MVGRASAVETAGAVTLTTGGVDTKRARSAAYGPFRPDGSSVATDQEYEPFGVQMPPGMIACCDEETIAVSVVVNVVPFQ